MDAIENFRLPLFYRINIFKKIFLYYKSLNIKKVSKKASVLSVTFEHVVFIYKATNISKVSHLKIGDF